MALSHSLGSTISILVNHCIFIPTANTHTVCEYICTIRHPPTHTCTPHVGHVLCKQCANRSAWQTKTSGVGNRCSQAPHQANDMTRFLLSAGSFPTLYQAKGFHSEHRSSKLRLRSLDDLCSEQDVSNPGTKLIYWCDACTWHTKGRLKFPLFNCTNFRHKLRVQFVCLFVRDSRLNYAKYSHQSLRDYR